MKYGVIGDIHNDPRIIDPALALLKQHNIEALILNGDIGEEQDTIKISQDYVAYILNAAAQTGLPVYVQPGSHESLFAYEPPLEFFCRKFSNLHNALYERKIEQDDHHLVFLPGSTSNSQSGSYVIGHEDISSGYYAMSENGIIPCDDVHQIAEVVDQGIAHTGVHYTNINGLRQLVTEPEKTLVVCHDPAKFDNLDTCVDYAYFGQTKTGIMSGAYVEYVMKQHGAKNEADIRLMAIQQGIELRRENSGYQELRDLFDELNITKALSNHFHESSHRAHDKAGNTISENTQSQELFYNSGHLDEGHLGIVEITHQNMMYTNLTLGR